MRKRRGFRALGGGVAVVGVLLFGPTARGAEVRVAAAADLKFALDAAVEEFRALRPDIEIRATYGSSGSFFAQVSSGAPFDLFLSADADTPARLREAGLVLEGSELLYGEGRIVVWVRNDSRLDVGGRGLEALTDPSVKKVAVANPRHAPYGRAAEAALKALALWDSVKGKLVLGENVAQAAQFVESGAAEAGIIALSLALAPPMRAAGRFAELPAGSYPQIRQTGVVLKAAKDPAAARTFLNFLAGAGRGVLSRFGLTPPER